MSYNSTEEWKSCEIFSFIIVGLFCSLVNLTGIIANSLAIVALLLEKNKLSTTYLLIGLEASDTILLISLSLSISFFDLFKSFGRLIGRRSPTDSYNYVNIVFKGFSTLTTGSLMASTWQTIVITFERYVAVCRPHSQWKLTKRGTLYVQSAICFIAIVINLGRSWEYKPIYIESQNHWTFGPTNLKKDFSYEIYVTIQYWLVQLIIPVLVLSIMTVLILKVNKFFSNKSLQTMKFFLFRN